jgi:hypothetical protein
MSKSWSLPSISSNLRNEENTSNYNSRQADKILRKYPKRTQERKINLIWEDLARCHKELGFSVLNNEHVF